MKFVQKDLGEAADVSSGKGGQFRELLILSAMTVALVAGIFFVIGLAVDLAVSRISYEKEVKLFGGSFSSLRDERQKGSDRELADLNSILKKLMRTPGAPPIALRLTLTSHKEPNAFAIPGGTIGVTNGLVKALGDEEIAMAFVLGHEIGHFKNRDHLRGLGRSLGMSAALSLLFSNNSAGDLLAGNTGEFMRRKYSRKQEAAADRFGMKLVYDAYGSVEGGDSLFQLLEEMEKQPDWAYMLATHPSPQSRINDLRVYGEELAAGKKKGLK